MDDQPVGRSQAPTHAVLPFLHSDARRDVTIATGRRGNQPLIEATRLGVHLAVVLLVFVR